MKYVDADQAYFVIKKELRLDRDRAKILKAVIKDLPGIDALGVLMKSETICWSCAKAGGDCSWSLNYKPVEGWQAVRSDVKTGVDDYVESYIVLTCPQYKKERRKKDEKEEEADRCEQAGGHDLFD